MVDATSPSGAASIATGPLSRLSRPIENIATPNSRANSSWGWAPVFAKKYSSTAAAMKPISAVSRRPM
ncbi:hypothetical protein R69608_07941 [Paraburkholderia nemoris]|uniref:Uncharacterized protein n=1 Tax=Paraburkholderia nemoris TaxID=2793076 RepID=A0ABM8T8T0_9BURK|nr:hypothetical protein R69619_07867 [Paraburkholderia nemoris]CAE6862543.1 hypothetical protein R75777_08101 [Paraburkholderia nemoris]CAE6865318.1 hypothetical protein R69776_08222 [Paraburkholderia nemoris]CAE6907968.1 hypothetical protein R69749_08497 [Paraburkholderia domus]CAE6973336.1 hypothetical protein R69608_07941 [Paraburkholderia nemoris]